MKRMSNVVRVACFGILMSLAISSSAQEPAKNIAESWLLTIKAGQTAEFEAAFTAHAGVRANHGDPRVWRALTPMMGEYGTRYLIRTCCFAWADQDEYQAWEAGNPEVLQDWLNHVQPHIQTINHNFSELDFKHSHWPNTPSDLKFVGVNSWEITPAQESDFRAARTELSQVLLNNGFATADRNWTWSETVGGSRRVSLAVPYASYAAMNRDRARLYNFLSEHMGPEGAGDLLARFAGSATHSTYQVWVLRPDLTPGN